MICRAYDSVRPIWDAAPLDSIASTAAEKAARAPRVSRRTLSHLQCTGNRLGDTVVTQSCGVSIPVPVMLFLGMNTISLTVDTWLIAISLHEHCLHNLSCLVHSVYAGLWQQESCCGVAHHTCLTASMTRRRHCEHCTTPQTLLAGGVSSTQLMSSSLCTTRVVKTEDLMQRRHKRVAVASMQSCCAMQKVGTFNNSHILTDRGRMQQFCFCFFGGGGEGGGWGRSLEQSCSPHLSALTA